MIEIRIVKGMARQGKVIGFAAALQEQLQNNSEHISIILKESPSNATFACSFNSVSQCNGSPNETKRVTQIGSRKYAS